MFHTVTKVIFYVPGYPAFNLAHKRRFFHNVKGQTNGPGEMPIKRRDREGGLQSGAHGCAGGYKQAA